MDGLKSAYKNEHASCEVVANHELPVEMRDVVREIISVWTNEGHRKQGYATELMKQVCEDADVDRKVLILTPHPFDSTAGISKDKLIEWYKRFGFVVTQKSPVLMARAPSFKVRQTMISAATEKAIRG